MVDSRSHLREWPTAFIGRDEEIATCVRLLAAGRPLLTIVGPPGVGKTRFANQLGQTLAERYPGGVWACDLSEADNVSAVCHAVAHVRELQLSGAEDDPLIDEVAASLQDGPAMLILLDNLESVLRPAARCLSSWLDNRLAAQFVATSRERTGVTGETILDLEGLPCTSGNEALAPAVALFCDRAEAVRTSAVDFDGDDMRRIADIVRALEGIPLAIELAAARTRVLGTAQIIDQLPRALDVFRQSHTDQARHATLRAAIDWSWRMLEPWEQRAAEQCSVFRGGFSVEAAEAVLDLGPNAPAVLDVVQSLCDKSLLASIDEDGQRRLRLFNLIAEYAGERLGSDQQLADVRQRHADYFADSGASSAQGIRGAGGPRVRARLRLERSNLLAAHEYLVGRTGDVSSIDRALAMLPAVEVAMVADQPLVAFRRLLDHTIATAEGSGNPELLARALLMRLRTAFAQTDVDVRDAERAIELLEDSSDHALRGLAWYYTGYAWMYRGQLDRALECFERAGELMAIEPPSHLLPQALGQVALINIELGRHDQARVVLDRALMVAQRAGASAAEWSCYQIRATLLRADGHPDRALVEAQRSLDLAVEIGEHWREVAILHEMVDIARDLGQLDDAHRWIERSRQLNQEMGWPLQDAYHRASLALLQEELGYSADAAGSLAPACETFRSAGFIRHYALLLVHQAMSLACAGRVEQSRQTLGRAVRELTDIDLDRSLVALTQGHLELSAAQQAQSRGDLEAMQAFIHRAEAHMADSWQRYSGPDLSAQVALPATGVADLRLLRRRFDQRLASLQAGSRLVLDQNTHELRTPNSIVSLRTRPAVRRMLYALCAQPGRTMSKAELAQAIWKTDYEPAKHDGPLKANVRNLRQLLRDTGIEIELVRGGYSLRAPSHLSIVGRDG